jgi:hypothetical protein
MGSVFNLEYRGQTLSRAIDSNFVDTVFLVKLGEHN